MSKPVGRPPLAGSSICVRLNNEALSLMTEGAEFLASVEGKSPSRAAWTRELMNHVFKAPLHELMDARALSDTWHEEWFSQATPHNVTIKVSHEHRVMLRRFECFTQSLDWTRELYRNEAVLLLIVAHGPAYNRSLEVIASAGNM
ncbi:hypothetical protein [Pseudomonas syringae]|uniref:hypothetical protein n=2 Tax=Pseudomonas syringae group TaxID=136849 RepID=UPI001604D453|nr:hypothetical protein [Pseudomonas syringae]MDH4602444.1 hypothetical protein [Pseudomonas syringae pv. papulans]